MTILRPSMLFSWPFRSRRVAAPSSPARTGVYEQLRLSVDLPAMFIVALMILLSAGIGTGITWKVNQLRLVDPELTNYYPFWPFLFTIWCSLLALVSIWIGYGALFSALFRMGYLKILVLDSLTFLPLTLLPFMAQPAMINTFLGRFVIFFAAVKILPFFFLDFKRLAGFWLPFRNTLLDISLIAAVVSLFYLPLVLTWHHHFDGENNVFSFWLNQLTILRQFDVPLWDPTKFAGVPSYVFPTGHPFELIKYILSLFSSIPLINYLDLYYWGSVFPRFFVQLLLAIGTYLLVTRGLGLRRIAGILSALFAAVNPLVNVNLTYESEHHFGIAMMPLLFFLYKQILSTRKSRNVILFSIVLALSYNVIPVNTEDTKSIVSLLILWALIHAIAFRKFYPLGYLGMGFLLSFLLSSVRWLPFLDYGLANPDLLADKAPFGFFELGAWPYSWMSTWGTSGFFFFGISENYVGIIFAFFLILGLSLARHGMEDKVRAADFAFFVISFSYCIVYYLGAETVLPRIVFHLLPTFKVHNQTRIMWFFGYFTVVLAAYGVHYYWNRLRDSAGFLSLSVFRRELALLFGVFLAAALTTLFNPLHAIDLRTVIFGAYQSLLIFSLFLILSRIWHNRLAAVALAALAFLDASAVTGTKRFAYNSATLFTPNAADSNRGRDFDLRVQTHYLKNNLWDSQSVEAFRKTILRLIALDPTPAATHLTSRQIAELNSPDFWSFQSIPVPALVSRMRFLTDTVIPVLRDRIKPPDMYMPEASPFRYVEQWDPLYQEEGFYRFINAGVPDWAHGPNENGRFTLYNGGGVCFKLYNSNRFKPSPRHYDFYFPPTEEMDHGRGNYTHFTRNRWKLDLLNIKYIVGGKADMPGVVRVSDTVLENLKVMPRAFLAYQYRVERDAKTLGGMDYRTQILLDRISRQEVESSGLKAQAPASLSNTYSEVPVRRITGNWAVFKVSSENAAILFYSDNYHPAWKAYVDGKAVSLYRADLAFKAVIVPRGDHLVWFEFRPWSVYIGWTVSCLAFLMMCAGVSRRS